MVDWEERAARAIERYDDGVRRSPENPDERQRQLTRMGNAAWAAGLSLRMIGRREHGNAWLLRAADTYRRSWPDSPPGSWGRPIAAMKARLIAGDVAGAREDARWALDARAAESESPIGRYAATLAHLLEGDDANATTLAGSLEGGEGIPPAVPAALVALASSDFGRYAREVHALVADFEAREEFLEDIPVADTVLALQALAASRGLVVELVSPLLPQT